MSSSSDDAFALVGILIGIGILLLLGIVVAIAYYILLWMLWQRYHYQAGEAFDEVFLERGDYRAEDVAYTLFGVRPQASRTQNVAEILFGVEMNNR